MLKMHCFICGLLITLKFIEVDVIQCPMWCINGALHTACLRENCEPYDYCTQLKMTEKLRKWLTQTHNFFRDHVAVNEMVGNMMALSYDLELEYVAQCWANACKFEKDLCRTIPTFPDRVGQNVVMGKAIKTVGHVQTIVEKWFTNGTAETRWAQTSHLGCGMSQNSIGKIIVVCNYGVPGGRLLDRGYIHGHTTSKCSQGERTHHEYTHLCTLESGARIFSFSHTYHLLTIFIILFYYNFIY